MEKIAVLLISSFLSYIGLAQETVTDEFKYKATYELTYQPDSTDVESTQSESMILYLADEISKFSSRGSAVGDSLMGTAKLGDRSMAAFQRIQAQIPRTEFQYNIIKHGPSGKIYYTEKVARDKLFYGENIPITDWQIQSETKEVAGYNAQKASATYAGRDYIAWFTTEIPITEGPYKFSGLPGLIVELSDEEEDYKFLLTNFQKLDPPLTVNFDPKDYRAVGKDEFREIKQNYERNPFAALEQAGVKIHFTPQQERKAKKDIKEKLEKNNNPIELE